MKDLDEFHKVIVKTVDTYGVRRTAELLNTSLPTIRRWYDRKTAPHIWIRESIAKTLENYSEKSRNGSDMTSVDFQRAEEIVDNLVTLLDKYDFTTLSSLERIDDYRDIIRKARNRDSITGKEFAKLMTKLGPLRTRSFAKPIDIETGGLMISKIDSVEDHT